MLLDLMHDSKGQSKVSQLPSFKVSTSVASHVACMHLLVLNTAEQHGQWRVSLCVCVCVCECVCETNGSWMQLTSIVHYKTAETIGPPSFCFALLSM